MVAFQLKALRWGRVSQGGTYASPENTASPVDAYSVESCGTMRNDAGTCSHQWHKSDTGCSLDVPPDRESENPGALAGATGAEFKDWLSWADNSLNREVAARGLLEAVLACDRRDRIPLMERFIDAMRAGDPLPPFMGIMTSARDWAALACRAELKAYCLASYEAMSGRDQVAFLAHIDRRAAA